MDYTGIRAIKDADARRRCIEGLQSIRKGLAAKVPPKSSEEFLLATWNIREFGGRKFGGRNDDAMYCIAECISRFDLVAVQEVRRDLAPLKRVLRYLGPQWDIIYNDVSYADGGNQERLAFVFNKAKVTFTGLAGELVLPSRRATELVSQVARTPFICGFQVGWAKFNLCTVHIYYGKAAAEDPRRIEEIQLLANLLADKADDYLAADAKSYSPENLVLLGDFNIFSPQDKTFLALKDNHFIVPKALQQLPTNVAQNKFYDQIAFYKDAVGIKVSNAGVFNFYDYVFNDPAVFANAKGLAGPAKFKEWRTYQMSDHLIMWAAFEVDKTDAYLEELAAWDGT